MVFENFLDFIHFISIMDEYNISYPQTFTLHLVTQNLFTLHIFKTHGNA